ncbi:MAG: hypothetical protein Q9192_003723 [Flavoplaca navasiana]
MRFRTHYRSKAMFANVLTEANSTIAKMDKRSTPAAKAKMMADLTHFCEYLIILCALVIIFMLWHDYISSWTDYDENTRANGQDYEDWEDYHEWIRRQREEADENAPLIRRLEEGPLSPDEVLRLSEILNDKTDKLLRSVKEVPLSAHEVALLTHVIRDADNVPDYGTIVSSRKRKAAEDSDEFDEGRLGNPRTRKLKIETDSGVDSRWVCKEFTRSPSFMSGQDLNSGLSTGCETPFTFRSPHPVRAGRSPATRRNSFVEPSEFRIV